MVIRNHWQVSAPLHSSRCLLICRCDSFVARKAIKWLYAVDVTEVGLATLREVPETTAALIFTSIHTLMYVVCPLQADDSL